MCAGEYCQGYGLLSNGDTIYLSSTGDEFNIWFDTMGDVSVVQFDGPLKSSGRLVSFGRSCSNCLDNSIDLRTRLLHAETVCIFTFPSTPESLAPIKQQEIIEYYEHGESLI
jgi:hypothetical protein